MELTQSWKQVFPEAITAKYAIAETRNASINVGAAHPAEFADIVRVLDAFTFDVGRVVRSGESKHLIPTEIDQAFRELGWREARYEQDLITRLILNPYRAAEEKNKTVRRTENHYGGHQVDNVKGRIALEVEWNPKDGNLDRDFGNFRALYDGGAIDAGIILTRKQEGLRDFWFETIQRAKQLVDEVEPSDQWRTRVNKTPLNPLGTSTTSNYEKLLPRIERGDGGGCPIIAIGITMNCFTPPVDGVDAEIYRLALAESRGEKPTMLAQRMGLI